MLFKRRQLKSPVAVANKIVSLRLRILSATSLEELVRKTNVYAATAYVRLIQIERITAQTSVHDLEKRLGVGKDTWIAILREAVFLDKEEYTGWTLNVEIIKAETLDSLEKLVNVFCERNIIDRIEVKQLSKESWLAYVSYRINF